MKSFSLVLPVWNEETFIAEVAHGIEKILEEKNIDYELLLVENGSSDGSLQVVQNLSRQNPRCRVVIRPKGYGSAVIGGLWEATKDWVAYMPSDGQIEPRILIDLLELMETEKYDLVKINRVQRENKTRKFISFFFNGLACMLFNLSAKDINGSPKVFAREWVPILDLKSTQNLIDTELMAKAAHLKWRIEGVDTQSNPRAGGKSHVNPETLIDFIRDLIQLRLSSELREFKKKASSEKKGSYDYRTAG